MCGLGETLFNLGRNPPHRGVDRRQSRGPRMGWQIGQVDVDRQARHVAHEEIDGRAALEASALLGRDGRQDARRGAALLR